MPPRSFIFRRRAWALWLGAAGMAWAQTGPARSPFLPAQASGGAAAPTHGAPLEYRGYMVTAEGTQYRLFDPAGKKGAWVRINERNSDLEVVAKQYDDAHRTLTVEHQGRTLTLAEREAKVLSGGAPPAMPPPAMVQPAPPPTNVAPAVTQSVVVNPTPADEQRRLEAVAAEVARRRALREQAANQVNQGPTTVVAPPAAPQPRK